MTELEESLGFLVANISRRMRQTFARHSDDQDITLTQATLLANIQAHEGKRQVELAELMGIQPITLGRLVDQLVERGLVERRPDPKDRRAYLLFQTPAAKERVQNVASIRAQVVKHALRGVDESELQQIVGVLQRIIKNLDEL